jgi:hypothetical protein
MRSFYEIARVDASFRRDHPMTMRLAPAPFKLRGRSDRQIQLVRGILRHVTALPGVRSAAISTDIPQSKAARRYPKPGSGAELLRRHPHVFRNHGHADRPQPRLSGKRFAHFASGCGINQTLADQFFPGKTQSASALRSPFPLGRVAAESSAWWRM